jgi:hypothetical protein
MPTMLRDVLRDFLPEKWEKRAEAVGSNDRCLPPQIRGEKAPQAKYAW